MHSQNARMLAPYLLHRVRYMSLSLPCASTWCWKKPASHSALSSSAQPKVRAMPAMSWYRVEVAVRNCDSCDAGELVVSDWVGCDGSFQMCLRVYPQGIADRCYESMSAYLHLGPCAA